MKKKAPLITEVTVAAAGMFLFALFAHTGLPLRILSFGGLFLTFVTLLYGFRSTLSPAVVLGLGGFSNRTAAYTVFGFLFGLALGVTHRWGYGLEILPSTFGRFAGVAALIGATEEILYRGYIQGRVRVLGSLNAVVFASLCHTVYKCSLFVFPYQPLEINIGFLAACTFTVGLIFGAFREKTGSVWPPVVAHVLFDIVVYGEYGPAPWWVWL